MNRAGRTLGLPRNADGPTVRLEKVAETDLYLVGDQRIQVKLNLVRIGLGCEFQALSDAGHMGIYTDGGLAKGVAPQDVGSLSPHTWQGHEILDSLWNLATEPVAERLTTRPDGLGLVPVKPGRVNLCF
jgi:hypothetical protein